MYLRRFQWMLKIIFLLFVFNQFQRVSCIHCGKFGFSCIDKRSYRKCNVYKKSYVDNFITLCPENTFCNEESKRACSSSSGYKNDDSQDKEINDIISTQFSNMPKTKTTTMAGCSSTTTTTTTTTTQSTETSTTTPCPATASSSLPVDNSKKLKKPPSPIHAQKNALGKKEKCKPNSKHNTKVKNKHSRDVWNYDHEPIFAFEDREKYSSKNERNTLNLNEPNKNSKVGFSLMNDVSDNKYFVNSDSNLEKNEDTYNKKIRIRFTNKDLKPAKFICPSVGCFPIESDDSCFYVCLNRRRSTYNELKAIKVYCPKSMYFNKISHRCENRSSKYSNRNINWQRSRLRNRKFHKHETYDKNKIFK